ESIAIREPRTTHPVVRGRTNGKRAPVPRCFAINPVVTTLPARAGARNRRPGCLGGKSRPRARCASGAELAGGGEIALSADCVCPCRSGARGLEQRLHRHDTTSLTESDSGGDHGAASRHRTAEGRAEEAADAFADPAPQVIPPNPRFLHFLT